MSVGGNGLEVLARGAVLLGIEFGGSDLVGAVGPHSGVGSELRDGCTPGAVVKDHVLRGNPFGGGASSLNAFERGCGGAKGVVVAIEIGIEIALLVHLAIGVELAQWCDARNVVARRSQGLVSTAGLGDGRIVCRSASLRPTPDRYRYAIT